LGASRRHRDVDRTGGSSRSIIAVSDGSAATSTRGVMQLLLNGQVRVLGRRVDGGSSSNYVTAGATPFVATAGQTYLLVGVFDFANGTIKAYIDGVQHTGGTGGTIAAGLSANTANLSSHIGTNTAGAGEQWNGLIDGARIFDHALTSAEILAIYNAEKVPEPTTLASACLALLGLASVRRRRSNA
jgi:hypothetical protein